MNYANRDTEYSELQEYLLSGVTPICIDTYHASGVTSFVKKRMQSVCSSLFGSNIFYIDAATEKSLSELLLVCLVQSDHIKVFQEYIDERWGEYQNSIISSALEGVPYIGPLLGRLTERRTAMPLYTGVYSSAMDELLICFFRESEHRFLIVIDTVELMLESSFEFLTKILKINSIQCILIRTEETIQYNKLENYLFEEGINMNIHINFDKPQVKLVKELGALYDITVSSDEASSIISKTKHNIHAIIKEIRNIKKCQLNLTMTPWEKAIIFVLNIWNSPLKEDMLYQIISMSELFSLNESATFQDTLKLLQAKEFIEYSQCSWFLKGRHNPQLCNVLNQISDRLLYKNIIYEFLSNNTNGENYNELRYRLSKELNCTTTYDAKRYLRELVICGKEVSQELMEDAALKKGNVGDCLLAGIKYCRERNFEEAFLWIDSILEEEVTVDIDAFRAILLNRVRKSEEAEVALIRCLQNSRTPAQQNILSSFLISTYIHMEKLAEAQTVYEERKDLFLNAPMHGYLVRNAISAFKDYREDLYIQALNDFRSEQDYFGYYTTLCNQGYALCKIKDYNNALKILEKAKAGLEVFPQSNLHIIYNNLGICYFLLGRYQDAYQSLLVAKRLGQNSMPRIFTTINLACVEAVIGHTERAIQHLTAIEPEVEKHKLDRVRQKFYINCLFVEALHGNKNINEKISKASMYPDRYFPEQTRVTINIYREFVNFDKTIEQYDWRDLYSPCGLAYWYMDPLKLFSEGIIY